MKNPLLIYNDLKQVKEKPLMGETCNSCGFCCIKKPCMLSEEILGHYEGPCRALEVDGDNRICGIVKRPAYYMFSDDDSSSDIALYISKIFAQALGIGRGCDATDENFELENLSSPPKESDGIE